MKHMEETNMQQRFAKRMQGAQKSFIREILKVCADPKIISFAGGLPHPISFPVEAIQVSTERVLREDGTNVLQYSTTEGYLPLRQWIADRYCTRWDLDVTASDILITTGSQQALDLIAKIFIDPDDAILMEYPGYLGAIQSFEMYQPVLYTAKLHDEGLDIDQAGKLTHEKNPKLLYCVPNFQNPTGITYTAENRKAVAKLIHGSQTILVEDNPYGELRFMGEDQMPIFKEVGENGILLGSFSKIVSPAMRLGWVCTKNQEIMDKLCTVKQGADLHTNYFTQRVLADYLQHNHLDAHIEEIKRLYGHQRQCMFQAIQKYFPKSVKVTKPEGGMFIWCSMPVGYSATELFQKTIAKKVAFVPGDPFYVNEANVPTFRLNYTNSSDSDIEKGIAIIGETLHTYLHKNI